MKKLKEIYIIISYFNSVKSSKLISFNNVFVEVKIGVVLLMISSICFFVVLICSFLILNFSVLLSTIVINSSKSIRVLCISFTRFSHIMLLFFKDLSCSMRISLILLSSKELSSIFDKPH